MILFARRLGATSGLHVVGRLRQLVSVQRLPLELVQGCQQGDGEGAGRTHTGTAWNVGHGTDLQTGTNATVQQAFA